MTLCPPTPISGLPPRLGHVIDAGQQPYRDDLQCAIDAAAAGDGIVFLPPLDGADEAYVVPHPPLRISHANMAIIGGGLQSRIRYPPGAAGTRPLIEIEARGEVGGRVSLESLWLDLSIPPDQLQPGTFVGIHVHADNGVPVLLRDLNVGVASRDTRPARAVGVELRSGKTRLTLDGVKIRGCSSAGLSASSRAEPSWGAVEIRNSTVESCGTGVFVEGLGTMVVRKSTVSVNSGAGIDVARTARVVVEGLSMEKNMADPERKFPLEPRERAQIRVGRRCEHTSIRGCFVSGVDSTPTGIAVFSEGFTTIVENVLDRHASTDVFLHADVRGVYPKPVSGKLPLNSKFEGSDPGLPEVETGLSNVIQP